MDFFLTDQEKKINVFIDSKNLQAMIRRELPAIGKKEILNGKNSKFYNKPH